MALQVCRNINAIKVCMETGRTVILLNLDHLYESLYDTLNQVHEMVCIVILYDLKLNIVLCLLWGYAIC